MVAGGPDENGGCSARTEHAGRRLPSVQQSPLTGPTNGIFSVAFSPDRRTLVTGSDDNKARLWDLSDLRHPSLLGTLTGHTDGIFSVAFGPDGHTLATASYDTTARLWETNAESVAARICGTAWPPINKDEWKEYLPGVSYKPPCPSK
jgi:WD40 repeat protein